MCKWVIPCPQQAVSSSVLSSCHAGSSPAVTSTNNNRFYCWPCQCPPEAAPAFSSQTLCFRNTMFCTLVKKEISSLVLLVIFFLSAVYLISCCLKYHWTPSFLFLSLCSLAAWLRLHLWAGFQRAAVWSSHITWLQDALSFTAGTLVPRWVQLLSTRGRQRRSHDHRQMHSGTETHRGRN